MRIAAGVVTDIGQVREGNEDAYLLHAPLYAVADGMGGHRGGEVASQLALETVEARYGEGEPLEDAVRSANTAVFTRSSTDRAVAGMGTTMTAVVIEPGSAHLVHVGDSRAYLYRGGTLRQLTHDHTLVQRMIDAGEITPAEAEVHPHRSVVLRALGTDEDVRVDVQDVGLLEGDRLILCSDGLTTMITEDQVAAIAARIPEPQDAADRLVQAANRAGGIDNITVLVLDVIPDGTDTDAAVGDAPEAQPRRTEGSTEPSAAPAWRGPAIRAVVAAVVIVAALVGFRVWLDGRWYVGVANDHVAIYQGIPATVLGYDLSHVVEETTIAADDVTALSLYTDLADGLNVDSRDEAVLLIDQIGDDLRASRRPTGGRDDGGGQGGTGNGGTP